MNSDDLTHPLHLLGLERERSLGEKAITALGFVAFGTLVGAAVGLLLERRGHTTGMLFSGKQLITNGHANAEPDVYGITS